MIYTDQDFTGLPEQVCKGPANRKCRASLFSVELVVRDLVLTQFGFSFFAGAFRTGMLILAVEHSQAQAPGARPVGNSLGLRDGVYWS
jgi:hypothetical protein